MDPPTEKCEMLDQQSQLVHDVSLETKEKEAEGDTEVVSWREKVMREIRPNKDLIPLKILAFFFYGGMFSITPFFTLHMQQLGISVQEIAVIYCVLPIPAILGPVISGVIADWSSRFKAILIVNILMSIVFNLSIIYTPTQPLPPPSVLSFNSSGISLANSQCFSPDEELGHRWMNWTCHSNCFTDRADVQELFSSVKSFRCYSTSQAQNPLDGCILPMAEEIDCGHSVKFFPLDDPDDFEHNIMGESFFYTREQCSTSCNQTAETRSNGVSSFSNSKTFWVYFFLRSWATFFMNSGFTMMDASTMAVLIRVGGDFGKQRLIAMLSLATFPFFASLIVEGSTAELTDAVDYSPAFYMMAVSLLLSAVIVLFINIKVEKKDPEADNGNVLKNIGDLFKRVEVDIFLVVLFLLGANWGFIENYLFVFLDSLNAPTYMLGLTMTFGCLTGVPMLLVSDRIVEWLGRDKVFLIGFLAYTVRMFGYSILTNPWYCFIFEALEVFTYQIMWVAAVTYYPILAPTSLLGTLAGISGAVHYNIGRGGGAFIGGFLIAHVGMVWTFRIFGIASFVFAISYYALQKLYIDKLLENKKMKETTDDAVIEKQEKC